MQRLAGLLVLVTLVSSGCSFAGGATPEPGGSRTPSDEATASPTAVPADEAEEEPMAMRVIVQVSLDVARVLHQEAPPTAESGELLEIAHELGVVLEPMHPGVEDPLLAPYFTLEVADAETADRVIARLLESGAVEAAYVKPRDELP